MTNPGYWNLYGTTDRIINAVGSKVVYPAESSTAQTTQDFYEFLRQFMEKRKRASFRSELDWSAKNWFEETAGRPYNDGTAKAYTDTDISALQSHVPEYIEIERKAKANGKWLKMPDGSTWPGDPRSWVQLMSNAAQEKKPKIFWTGIKAPSINPEYNGQLWGVYGQGVLPPAKARTYAVDDSHVLPMFTSKDVPMSKYDAKGKMWYNIEGRRTNDIVAEDFANGKQVVRIENVMDTGSNTVSPTNSHFSLGNTMMDWYIINNPSITQNDLVLAPGTYRKSLLGNNGDFSSTTNNIYKSFLPPSLGYGSLLWMNSNSNNGK